MEVEVGGGRSGRDKPRVRLSQSPKTHRIGACWGERLCVDVSLVELQCFREINTAVCRIHIQ